MTRADVCVLACAETFRGDGEILASAMSTVSTLGARLARATFEPDLLISDGEAYAVAGELPIGGTPEVIEGWIPYRSVFDVVASGRRHVIMGATQIDPYGNTNISAIGEWSRPTRQLLGCRGAPGNTANHPTSYFIPKHGPRVFVEQVSFVSGVGYDRAAEVGPALTRFHEIRRVVTDLAVLDFGGPDHRMRLRSVHPGVTVEQVVEATGFPLVVGDSVPVTPEPSPADLEILGRLDPRGLREREVPA